MRLTGGMVCGQSGRCGMRVRRMKAAREKNVVDVAARKRQMRTKAATGQLYFLARRRQARYFLLVSC